MMEILDGFGMGALDAIAGASQAVLPVGIGMGVTYGLAQAVDFLVKNTTVKKWKWAIGFAGAGLIGLGLWKWRSPVDGALTIGSGFLTAGMGFGTEKLNVYKAKKGLLGFGRYVMSPGQPLLDGLGRYVVAPTTPLLAGMDRGETIGFQGLGDPNYVNPGYFVSA